jgi:hypothetical protein
MSDIVNLLGPTKWRSLPPQTRLQLLEDASIEEKGEGFFLKATEGIPKEEVGRYVQEQSKDLLSLPPKELAIRSVDRLKGKLASHSSTEREKVIRWWAQHMIGIDADHSRFPIILNELQRRRKELSLPSEALFPLEEAAMWLTNFSRDGLAQHYCNRLIAIGQPLLASSPTQETEEEIVRLYAFFFVTLLNKQVPGAAALFAQKVKEKRSTLRLKEEVFTTHLEKAIKQMAENHLEGDIGKRSAEIDQVIAHHKIEEVRALAHRFFSRERSYEKNSDHFLLWFLLHYTRELPPSLFPHIAVLMKKMVADQERYFCTHSDQITSCPAAPLDQYDSCASAPSPPPPKKNGKSPKSPPLPSSRYISCYYVGGSRNWEEFRSGRHKGVGIVDLYPSLPVRKAPPPAQITDEELRKVGSELISHCDSFVLSLFEAPDFYFLQHQTEKEKYRIVATAPIKTLSYAIPQPIQEKFSGVMRELLKEQLTEEVIKERYASMAAEVIPLLVKRKLLPPPPKEQKKSPIPTAITSPRPPPATERPAPLPSPSASPSAPPPPSSRTKPLLLLFAFASLALLLWKGIPRIRSWWRGADPALAKIEKS